MPDPTELVESDVPGRVPSAEETAVVIARAQAALAEISARVTADAIRATEETAEAARREELARWAEEDRAAEDTTTGFDDELVRDF